MKESTAVPKLKLSTFDVIFTTRNQCIVEQMSMDFKSHHFRIGTYLNGGKVHGVAIADPDELWVKLQIRIILTAFI